MGEKSIWNDWVTPDLARNPALASDVMKSSNPSQVAPVISMVNKGVAVQDAINDHAEGNGTASFWNSLGDKVLTGLEWINKPLKEVQRAYKFTHSVYTDHGFLPGFAVTLGVVGGTVGGAFLGGPLGAIIGTDLAAAGLRKLSTVGPWEQTYKDSYNKSNDENYVVSPGRDFSNVASKAFQFLGNEKAAEALRNTDKGVGKFVSGFGDTVFDINVDPAMILGRFGQLTRNGKLFKAGTDELKHPIMATVPGTKNFLLARSKVPINSEQIDMVRSGNGIFNKTSRIVNRAVEDIAKSSAGEIIQKYPELGTVAAGRLGQMTTADEVWHFFKTSLYFGELQGTLAGQAMLPSRTLLRAKFGDSKIVDILRNASVSKYIIDATGKRVLNPEWNPLSAKQRLGGIYKTFSGYMPYSVDPETLKLSNRKFRWDANDAATVVYRIARVGMDDKSAKMYATKYAEAVALGGQEGLALARSIKNQAIFDMFKAVGLPEDDKFVMKVWDEINKLDIPQVGSSVYGVNHLGEVVGEYIANNGLRNGGLVSHQAQDMFNIPDFMEIKKIMRQAGKFSKFVGPLDEWTAKHYTNSIFKPLALATAGFGLRIAASEAIPMFARYGVINTIKAKIATSAAKANVNVAPKEANSIVSAALIGLGAHMGIPANVMTAGFPAFQEAKRRGLNFAAKMLPDEQVELATKLILANEGHITSEAVTTGHGYDAATNYLNNTGAHYYFQIKRNGPMFKDQPEWTTYTAENSHYAPLWSSNLNKASKETTYQNIAFDLHQIGKNYTSKGKFQLEDDITKFTQYQEFKNMREVLIDKEYKRMIDALDGKYKGYDKEIRTLSRWQDVKQNGEIRSFAADRVDSLLGMVVGKDGFFHEKLAFDLASKKAPDWEYVSNYARDFKSSSPAAVAGPVLEPYVPSKNPLVYITNLGFKKVIDPIVNGLAREPLYLQHVADAYMRLKPLVDAGQMLDDQALRIAQTQASYSMLPQIHNTSLRNQFSQIARNFLPFYFAQEQALKRAFNTLKDTSVASPLFSRGLRFYQIAEHAVNDPAYVETDANGNRYVYIPFVGAWGESVQNALATYGVPIVSGLPIITQGSLISLKTVLPELQFPGVSPVGAISANWIADLFPSLKPIITGVIGDIAYKPNPLDPKQVADTFIPATWFKTAISTIPGFDLTNQMANATASALAAAYYHNQVPGPDSTPQQQQQFIERIKNNARSILILKTFLNLTSPLAPRVSQEDAGFRDEFWKLVKEKGNYSDALLEFMGRHGSRAVSYTVARTKSNVPGAKYPYIQETVDFINANKDKFDYKSDVANGYYYLIPQDNSKNEMDRGVFVDLLGQHLRSYRSPEELLKQFYVAQGDAIMSPLIKQHVEILNNAEANYDSYSKQVENDRWSGIINSMKMLHPIWYADYTSNEGKTNAQIAYNQLQKIFASPDAPNHEQANMVRSLMQDYQKHSDIINQYRQLNIQGAAVQIENNNWDNYLSRLIDSEPRLAPVVNSVFRKLG